MSDARAVTRTNNMAAVFQEVLTAVLRLRSQPQTIQNTDALRTQLRQLLQSALGEARTLGYSSQHVQMCVLVTVAFLDETVLNLNTPAASEWSRRPLQEELFGGHMAGETVFQNLQALLQQQDAPELADVLEIHCLCLELGYKGRYAFSNGGEIRQMIQLCLAKIHRARGAQPMFAAPKLEAPTAQPRADSVARALMIAAIVLAVVSLGSFAGYEYSLSTQASHLAAGAAILR